MCQAKYYIHSKPDGAASVYQKRSLMEFWRHILSGCQVCDWGIQYHLCSIYIERIVRVGGCLPVVAQWQSTGCTSQRCPGFDSRQLPAFCTFLYFCLITSNPRFRFLVMWREGSVIKSWHGFIDYNCLSQNCHLILLPRLLTHANKQIQITLLN